MVFVIIILVVLGIGILSGLIGRAKANIEVKQEEAHLEKVKNSRRTHATSYRIGSLYSRGDKEGMVVAVDATGRHGRFVDFETKCYKWNVKKALNNWSILYGNSYSASCNAQSYNTMPAGLYTIPTIQDLQIFRQNLDRFYQLRDERRGGPYGQFPDVRFENLGIERKILSRDITTDSKSVYVYDICANRVSTMPISDDDMKYDDEDITCGIILVGFF